MNYLFEGFITALKLIFTFDHEVMNCTWVSLKISSAAILFASLVGVPLGFFIGANNFKGKKAVITLFNTMMALPTVVVGLFVFSFISNSP